MGNTCTIQQRREAAAIERKDIEYARSQGSDVSIAEDYLEFFEKNIDNTVRLNNQARKVAKQFKDLPNSHIAKINANNPVATNSKTGGKYKVKILSGYTGPNGVKVYTVTTGNGKEYPLGAHMITLDQIDAQHSQSDVLYAEPANNNTSYKAKTGDKILDSENINSIEHLETLVDTLKDMDNVTTTPEHMEHIHTMLQKIVGGLRSPIQEMNVYLDKKYKKNHGFVEFGDDEGVYLKAGRSEQQYGNEMGLPEMLLHELTHGAMHYAKKNYGAQLSKQFRLLEELRFKTLDALTAEDLLGDVVLHREEELAIAESRLDHMAGKDGLEEFAAMAVSNPKIYAKVKEIQLHTGKDKATLGGALYNLIADIILAALDLFGKGERTMRGDKLLMKLLAEIGQVNKEANKTIERGNVTRTVTEAIDDMEDKFVNWMNKLEDKDIEKAKKAVMGKGKLSIPEMVSVVHYVVGTVEGAPIMQQFLSMLGIHEEGAVQTVIRHMKHADKYGNRIMSLIAASDQVDMHRETLAQKISDIINRAMGKKQLTMKQHKATYAAMMMGDGLQLVNQLGNNTLQEVYKDDIELDYQIDRLESLVQEGITTEFENEYGNTATRMNKGELRSVISQAKGLAALMYTGKSSIVQRKNAGEIVRYSIKSNLTNRGQLVEDVDTLASLYAVKLMDSTVRTETADVLKSKPAAIKIMAEMQKGFRDEINEKSTPMEKANLIKNYHRETYRGAGDVKIENTSYKTKQEMQKQGYMLKKILPSLGLGYENEELGIYVNNVGAELSHNRTIFRGVADRESGMTLWKDATKRDMTEDLGKVIQDQIANGKKLEKQYEKAVRAGKEAEFEHETHVVPVIAWNGNTVGYTVETLLEDKVRYYGLQANTAEAVGRTQSHELDIHESKELNQVAWDTLIDDMIENVVQPGSATTGKNLHNYIDISKLSDVKEVKDGMKIMPDSVKKMMREVAAANIKVKQANELRAKGESIEYIEDNLGTRDLEYNEKFDEFELSDNIMVGIVGKEKWDRLTEIKQGRLRMIFAKDKFKVRRDMLLDIFGVRNASAAGLIPGKGITSAYMKKAIRIAEIVWQDIVKIFKINIIIRTPAVLMGNIVSGVMRLLQEGLNVKKVVQRYKDGMFLLRDHIHKVNRMAELIGLMAAKPVDKKLAREYKMLQLSVDDSPLSPLIKVGLYSHIAEELSADDIRSSSKLAQFIYEKTQGAPELLKTAGNWFFLNEKTSYFKMVTAVTGYSDFVARYVQYSLTMEREEKKHMRKIGKRWTESERQDVSDKTLRVARDAHVFYPKPDSALMQYANDMGMVAFSKYAIRIQVAIQDLVRGKPIRFGMALLSQDILEELTGINPDDIGQLSIWHRDIEDWVYTPGISKIINSVTHTGVMGLAA